MGVLASAVKAGTGMLRMRPSSSVVSSIFEASMSMDLFTPFSL